MQAGRGAFVRWLPRGLFILLVMLIIGSTTGSALDEISGWLSFEYERLPWYTTRITALLAYLALSGSVVYGLLLSTKILDGISHRAVSYTLHGDLAGIGVALALVHAAVLALDRSVPYSLVELLVPFAGPYRPLWVGIGQLTLGLSLVVLLSFYVRKRIGQRTWRLVHYLSFVAFVGATAHGLMAGSDTSATWAYLGYLTIAALVLFLVTYRDHPGPWRRHGASHASGCADGRGSPANRYACTRQIRRPVTFLRHPTFATDWTSPIADSTERPRPTPPDRRAETVGNLSASVPLVMDATDRALADGLLAGDERAFRHLVDREMSSVFQVCYRILGDIHEAEDATQEAFVQAYRALATYRGEGKPAAWLARIATREAWRRGSSRSRRRATTVPLMPELAATLADGSDPQREALVAEEQAQVRSAVASLPEPYREIISLRYLSGLSLAEISDLTGRPLGTVKAQVHRGIDRLRDSLGGRRA